MVITTYNAVGAPIETGNAVITIVAPFQQVQLNAEIAQSIQIATNSGSVNIQVDPDTQLGQNWVGTDGLVSDKSEIEVKTNAFNGYSILVQLAGATSTGSAVLDGDEVNSQIASNSGERNTTENNFTFALNVADATNVLGFENTAQSVIGSGLGAPTNSHIDTFYYYLNVDHTLPQDTYRGTITYTAVGQF